MNDTLRKALLLGIGSITYSKKLAEEKFNQFITEHNINKEEGEALVKEMLEKLDGFKSEQEKMVRELVDKATKEANLATKKDIERLEDLIKDVIGKKD